ncbi:hypothetical protein LUTEI9C_10248 [Luteimonas sp. 9C]|nr:hypothetical protein LUTEI9C_10248 [Luteimonas sp. 9C]
MCCANRSESPLESFVMATKCLYFESALANVLNLDLNHV